MLQPQTRDCPIVILAQVRRVIGNVEHVFHRVFRNGFSPPPRAQLRSVCSDARGMVLQGGASTSLRPQHRGGPRLPLLLANHWLALGHRVVFLESAGWISGSVRKRRISAPFSKCRFIGWRFRSIPENTLRSAAEFVAAGGRCSIPDSRSHVGNPFPGWRFAVFVARFVPRRLFNGRRL